jgi:protein O-mannosyl-transferase
MSSRRARLAAWPAAVYGIAVPHPGPGSSRGAAAIGAAALATLVLLVYGEVGGFGFVEYDDGAYVFENAVVRGGLGWSSVVWAFTTFDASNWHPLTWISLLADVSLFGVDPGWMHRMNVAWHFANSLLLWIVLERLTGERWRSWLVATLFAVHPLHVESVAWISERKDVLSTFFFLLALGAWRAYVARPSARRYAAVAALHLFGLLSKPMVVTLPVVLLLVDVWPLGRLAFGPGAGRRLARLLVEKVPLLALSAASSLVTIFAQHQGGATATAEGVPYAGRVGNALLAAASYLEKTVWPANLAVFYPNPAVGPAGLPVGHVALAALLLAALTALAVWQRTRRPYLLVGWLWFGVTLLPVIGLVQVGLQGMADRYTYVPLIGIFVALAWALPGTWVATRPRALAVGSGVAAMLLVLAVAGRAQASTWRDSLTLFEHAAQVTEGNWLAWKNVGFVRYRRGETLLALEAFRRSAQARPDEPDIWFNLGAAHATLDQHAQAAESFRRAILLAPEDAESWFALGISRAMLAQPDGAAEAVTRLERLDPAKARELDGIAQRIARQLAARPR